MKKHSDYAGEWIIRSSRGSLEKFLTPDDVITVVEHRCGNPPVVYYTLKRERAGNSPLDTLTLFPRGHEAVRWDPTNALLPRGHRPWSQKLKDIQLALRAKARRLEGDFGADNANEAVMVWLVEGAVKGKDGSPQPILIIDLKLAEQSLEELPGESGTGTGDPKK